MTQFNNELYAGFLPEAGDVRFEGKRGFYPAMTAEEYRALPLPMKCAPWDAAFQKRYCSSCTAENCDACANEQFRNNPEWWLSLPAAEVEQ